MMIDLGKTEVFERKMPHPIDCGVNIDRAAAHLLKKQPELVAIHYVRITNGLDEKFERVCIRKYQACLSLMKLSGY